MNNEFKESKELFKEATVSFRTALMHVSKIALITAIKYIKGHKVFDTIAIGIVIYIIMIGQIISYRSQEQSVGPIIMNLKDTIYNLRQENEFMREKNIAVSQKLSEAISEIKQSHRVVNSYSSHYRHYNKSKKDSI